MAVEAFVSTSPAIARRALTLPLVGLAVVLAALSIVSISVLSAARAYVGGESQWSRSQKSASHHLMRYADTRAAADWERYSRAIAVPLGDRRAREALNQPEPDLALVREGFVAGMNHPDDVPGMIRLYRWFRGLPFMARAIDAWAEGDALIAQLHTTAESLHQAVQAQADAATLAPLRERVYQIDDQLTPVEERFSATLGEAARGTHALLVGTVLLSAATLVAFGVLLMRRAAGREQQQTQALRDSEARFQRAMVGSSDGFWEWDLARDIAYFSPRFETLLGYGPGQMASGATQVRALLHPDDVAVGHAAMQDHLKRGEPYDVVLRLRCADGQFRWMRSRAQVQRGPGPHELRLAGSIVDVTERREAEQALRRSETLFRSLWETTADAVLILGTDHLIRFANPAAHDLFGYARGTLLGQPLSRLQPEGLRAAHQAGVARYL
ncbi:MAG: PAS domain S-box protein, partial [Burkholderiales bacterium]|nr:PAS domain S-box protein [Burkholderiales bacterium]